MPSSPEGRIARDVRFDNLDVCEGVYAPDIFKQLEEREEFWAEVRDVLVKCERNKRIVMLGDFIGWMGVQRDEIVNEKDFSINMDAIPDPITCTAPSIIASALGLSFRVTLPSVVFLKMSLAKCSTGTVPQISRAIVKTKVIRKALKSIVSVTEIFQMI
ncbi:hypothetical protein EVAR_54140_1 [Eumeta japonica]|uniref:Uncharacterized protein n=1 Tax=Eumeta variegata TaxID=151549 RepID=A0A4C1YXH1_EUMVA|nr:hypothetical protein EVAR_54140_1 [Eumeta japonica]